jgi:hypothetical protein
MDMHDLQDKFNLVNHVNHVQIGAKNDNDNP